MKRYLLFAGDTYYASGGMQDFVQEFTSIEDAVKYYEDNKSKKYWDWWQVLDKETGDVFCSKDQAHNADESWKSYNGKVVKVAE